MAIYTRRGDKGETSLFDKKGKEKRVNKDSLRIYAIGALDELNSHIGFAASLVEDKKILRNLLDIQKDLLKIGSILAGSRLRFAKSRVKALERQIDKIDGDLPVLKNFILPGGSLPASTLHIARSIARRAERRIVSLAKTLSVNEHLLSYLNRLSDYLFMLARVVNYKMGQKEKIWKGKKK